MLTGEKCDYGAWPSAFLKADRELWMVPIIVMDFMEEWIFTSKTLSFTNVSIDLVRNYSSADDPFKNLSPNRRKRPTRIVFHFEMPNLKRK
jgi:hypothetical protein